MRRRNFLQLLAASGAGALAASSWPERTEATTRKQRPNFLILVADEHNPHVLGCSGDPVVKTPHLDALAARGTLFESAYAQAPWCVPSRTSFLTARHPSQTKVRGNDDALPTEVSTWSHVLGAAGYETVLIGNMHFNGPDQHHGFEKRLVGSLNPIFPNGKWPMPKELMEGAYSNSRGGVELAGPGRTAYQVYDEQVTDAAVQYLLQKTKDQTRPFCAVVGFVLPHPPFICPKDLWLYYLDRVTIPQVPPGYFDHLNPAIRRWRKDRGIEELPDEVVRKARAGYYGLVTQHDALIGKIFDVLEKEPGLRETTAVAYTSDHGEMAGENGMWWKNNFYEGSVSVPLIVTLPGSSKRLARRSEVVSLIDIGPTLIELAGENPWDVATGRSLVPLLSDQPVKWDNVAFSEHPPVFGEPPVRMIRSGKWKLVHYDGATPQLFNLETDPHEFHDLGQDPAYVRVREELMKRVLQGWSAEEVRKEVKQHAEDFEVVRRWYIKTDPPMPPDQWFPPRDANQYPAP